MKKDKSINHFKLFEILIYIQLAAALLFSFFNFVIHPDISILAFPISLVFTISTGYISIVKIIRQQNGRFFIPLLKLVQYIPYGFLLAFIIRRAGDEGTAYWFDVVTVIFWIIVFVCSIILSYKMNEKHYKTITVNWKIQPSFAKPKGSKRIIYEIVDWIDAIVWALFTVLLVQIFIFQLYTIPSESMVPTFLVNDRVAVSKLDCGPKFPLTDIGLPDFREYKRGDTIVLRNPHYTIDRKSEVKSVTSQLIYMLTLMQVNINTDENGAQKADPLVKRITGLPGEQLVMQDGTLYSRTKDSDDWTPAAMDQKYATWNLAAVKPELLSKIQQYPLSDIEPVYVPNTKIRTNTSEVVNSSREQYELMLEFEEDRRNFDLDAAMFQAKEIVNKFSKLSYKTDLDQNFVPPSLLIYQIFNQANIQDLTRKLMTQNGGLEWFNEFMTSWIQTKNVPRDMYSESNYKIDVMGKIYLGNLVVRYAELMRNSVSAAMWINDPVLTENLQKSRNVVWYVQMLLDFRNMKVFPANDSDGNPQYIPSNCYFMMGDNRFNSLDLRHGNDYKITKLVEKDGMSFTYQSLLNPQYINKKYIIGKPIFRFWPANRISRIR